MRLTLQRSLEVVRNVGCAGKGYSHAGWLKYLLGNIFAILFFTAEDEERLE